VPSPLPREAFPLPVVELCVVNRRWRTIVGVMPASFAFPDGNAVELYSPLVFTADELNGRRSHTLTVIGRLKPDVTVDSATADVRAIAQRIFPTDRTSNPDVTIASAHDVLVEDVRLGLIVLFGTVGFVLLIACANVASLLLVRGSVRRREVAMRAALGAGRGRLLRQLLPESVLLAIIGAAAGVVVAWGPLMALAGNHPPNLPRVDQIAPDGPVLLFVTVAAVLTGVVFGIIPALQAATPRLSDATRVVTPTYTAASRGRFGLVAGEWRWRRSAGSRAGCRRCLRRHVVHSRSAGAGDRRAHDAWSAAERSRGDDRRPGRGVCDCRCDRRAGRCPGGQPPHDWTTLWRCGYRSGHVVVSGSGRHSHSTGGELDPRHSCGAHGACRCAAARMKPRVLD
jgi:hypothetical protein